MGGLLTLPLKLSSLIVTVADKGFTFASSYVTCYIYFTVAKWFKKDRLNLYDYTADDQPEKNSFFVPALEWELDSPQNGDAKSTEKSDDVFCFGVNSKSEALAVYISRRPNEQVQCSLLLQLSDGRVFCLPKEHVVQHESEEEHTFGSSRLKLQCILPMRKWRIFFNGLLAEWPGKSGVSRYRHVRMTFLCTSSSEVFDFSCDMSNSLLAYNASTSMDWKFSPKSYLEWVRNTFCSYDQPKMLLGTVKVDGESEREMYLWGTRGRYNGSTRNLDNTNFFQIYGYFTNGAILHLGILNLSTVRFVYGYLMRSDGFIFPFEELIEGSEPKELAFKFFSGGVNHCMTVTVPTIDGLPFGKEFGAVSTISYTDMMLDGIKGWGFIFKGTNSDASYSKSTSLPKFRCTTNEHDLSVLFSDVRCQDSGLTGGKGSSLGKLYSICEELTGSANPSLLFNISNGFVVTTKAYGLFIRGKLEESLQNFEREVWSLAGQDIRESCKRIVQEVEEAVLPESVVRSLTDHLNALHLSEEKKFAVRSSAIGEDTDQMSAAGQMDTFLGLKTIQEISVALKKCWASQFSFQAVEYKRRYGQLLNSSMAVVIQEMVPCEVAGVAFTCDPVTGDPSYINITANWGLGESVVSAAAEPDTVVLHRDICNRISIHNEQVGKKHSKIVMSSGSGTAEIALLDEQSAVCCLKPELSLRLGQLAILIEEKFGSSRDLEWGILRDEIYLFQARPVTSLDVHTDFETKHFSDAFLRNEKDYVTTGNVGEVMPGAISLLGQDFFSKMIDISLTRKFYNRDDQWTIPDVPYFPKRIIFLQNHSFFAMVDSLMRFKQKDSDLAKGMMIAILGRIFIDDEMTEMARERHEVYGKVYENSSLLMTCKLFLLFFMSTVTKWFKPKLEQFRLTLPSQLSSKKMLYELGYNMHVYAKALQNHMVYTITSSIWNMTLMSTMAKTEGDWNNNVYSGFAYLLSTCTDVESADVPNAIQKLAWFITKSIEPEKFSKLSNEEALVWLQTSDTEAGKEFRKFLEKHGHRCLKEFDLYSETWGANPRPLLKTLQDLVAAGVKQSSNKELPSFNELLSNLHIKFSFFQRLFLRWLIPACWRGVRGREASKSVCIKVVNQFRIGFSQLVQKMLLEGYVPNKDLLYFMCIEEIIQLLETRSPRIVARAIKRQKVHKEMDKLIFPELSSGIPIPINDEVDIDASAKGFCMSGIPVSQGVAKAIARVVTNLNDASTIKPGDILIAHSTDIGWSPYFPLLSGVVTELGGLISHGAVVAREYGLPCVVGLHGATRAFNSGDLVVLDGNKGTLQRIDS